jgi:hypothetical protein
MTFIFKIIFSLTLTLYLNTAFGQTITKKQMTGKWRTNLANDSLKIGDTIFFRTDGYIQFDFKSNLDLKRHLWYAKCGNHFFLDNFARKPPAYESVGNWALSTLDNKTFLKTTIHSKTFTLLFISKDKKQSRFIIQGITSL